MVHLSGKMGALFTSAASVHGGQETTAVSIMVPMLHHGIIMVGVPYSAPKLTESGNPYGPSRIVGRLANKQIAEAKTKVIHIMQ